MIDVARRELRGERPFLLDLPETFREREQFLARNPRPEVDAVDAEVGQLAKDLGLRVGVVPERHAVHVRDAVDHVEPQRRRVTQVPLNRLVDFRELLLDRRMSRRIHARQPAEADDPLEQRDRVERRRFGCVRLASGRRHRFSPSTRSGRSPSTCSGRAARAP